MFMMTFSASAQWNKYLLSFCTCSSIVEVFTMSIYDFVNMIREGHKLKEYDYWVGYIVNSFLLCIRKNVHYLKTSESLEDVIDGH